MGLPVCANLVRAGFSVTAADVRPQAQAAARGVGAGWADTPAAAAAGADVVFTMLPGPPEVTDAMLGTGGVLDAMAAGAVWIDLTSSTPAVGVLVGAAAERGGVGVLDVPVGGGVSAAESGELSLYVGGDAAVLEAHRELLSAFANRITYMGGHGAGYLTKLLVNLLWFGQAVATGEALLLAARFGLDLEAVRAALASSAAGSEFLRQHAPALLAGDYLTTFGLDRCHEELAGITALADEYAVPFELGKLVTGIHARALAEFGPQDGELLAVALLEQEAGLLLRSSDAEARRPAAADSPSTDYW